MTNPLDALFPVLPYRACPVGTVSMFAGTSLPPGHLWCDGSAVSRATYVLLFTVIGTTYGAGDGSTTFNVPDLRGRVCAGRDDMGGTSANRLTGLSGGVDGDVLGASGGAEAHQLTEAELAAHTHPQDSHNHTQDAHGHAVTDPGHTHSYSGFDATNSTADVAGSSERAISATTGSATTGLTVDNATATNQAATATNQNTGGDTAHNNVQPTFILNFIIVAAV